MPTPRPQLDAALSLQQLEARNVQALRTEVWRTSIGPGPMLVLGLILPRASIYRLRVDPAGPGRDLQVELDLEIKKKCSDASEVYTSNFLI